MKKYISNIVNIKEIIMTIPVAEQEMKKHIFQCTYSFKSFSEFFVGQTQGNPNGSRSPNIYILDYFSVELGGRAGGGGEVGCSPEPGPRDLPSSTQLFQELPLPRA
jgi:hypothetical protein